MNTYEVVVKRTVVQYTILTINAPSEDAAADIAEQQADALVGWSWQELESNEVEVLGITQI